MSTERPILFSAPMVQALLDGRKTQQRQLVKPQPTWTEPGTTWSSGFSTGHSGVGWYAHHEEYPEEGSLHYRCPFGVPGDRLWVRETWGLANRNHWPDLPHMVSAVANGVAYYRASFDRSPSGMCWRPSIHMPRWASRLTLEVTGVRVERLRDITEKDAAAEGVEPHPAHSFCKPTRRLTQAFATLWDSLNGKRAPWASNPWVWVVEFKRKNGR